MCSEIGSAEVCSRHPKGSRPRGGSHGQRVQRLNAKARRPRRPKESQRRRDFFGGVVLAPPQGSRPRDCGFPDIHRGTEIREATEARCLLGDCFGRGLFPLAQNPGTRPRASVHRFLKSISVCSVLSVPLCSSLFLCVYLGTNKRALSTPGVARAAPLCRKRSPSTRPAFAAFEPLRSISERTARANTARSRPLGWCEQTAPKPHLRAHAQLSGLCALCAFAVQISARATRAYTARSRPLGREPTSPEKRLRAHAAPPRLCVSAIPLTTKRRARTTPGVETAPLVCTGRARKIGQKTPRRQGQTKGREQFRETLLAPPRRS